MGPWLVLLTLATGGEVTAVSLNMPSWEYCTEMAKQINADSAPQTVAYWGSSYPAGSFTAACAMSNIPQMATYNPKHIDLNPQPEPVQ